jgi:hypothetical protein
VPAPRSAGFTETVSEAGVFPEAGETESHPLLEAAAVNGMAVPVLETARTCGAGLVSPA